jgi:hypothetical protein
MKLHGKKRKHSVVLTRSRYALIEECAERYRLSVPRLLELWAYEMLKGKVSQQLYDTAEKRDYIDLGYYKAANEIRQRLPLGP